MIASIALMLVSAAASTTTCESLANLELDKATIMRAQLGAEGPAPAPGGGRTKCPAPRTNALDDPGALRLSARPQADSRLRHQHGDLAPAGRQVEREVHGSRQRWLRRVASGAEHRDAAGTR